MHPAPGWKVNFPGTVRAVWIGELSARSRLPRRTMRLYEEEGPLPEPSRTPSGYRDYRPEALERLSLIRAAKHLGLRENGVSHREAIG